MKSEQEIKELIVNHAELKASYAVSFAVSYINENHRETILSLAHFSRHRGAIEALEGVLK